MAPEADIADRLGHVGSVPITVQKSMTDRKDANATNVNSNPRISPAASAISTSQDKSAEARPDTG
jgi:hypothetical protein